MQAGHGFRVILPPLSEISADLGLRLTLSLLNKHKSSVLWSFLLLLTSSPFRTRLRLRGLTRGSAVAAAESHRLPTYLNRLRPKNAFKESILSNSTQDSHHASVTSGLRLGRSSWMHSTLALMPSSCTLLSAKHGFQSKGYAKARAKALELRQEDLDFVPWRPQSFAFARTCHCCGSSGSTAPSAKSMQCFSKSAINLGSRTWPNQLITTYLIYIIWD